MSLPVKDILKAYGFDALPTDENNVKCLCPFHKDTNPSCSIEVNTGVWNCFVCDAKGSIYNLLARKVNKAEIDIRNDLALRFGVSNDKTANVKAIERYCRALLQDEWLQSQLFYRGLTPELIVYYRLGADKDRITIPIKNTAGYYVNVRRYKPDAKHNKFISQKGRGENRLYPIEQLSFDTIVLCGGEIKAIVAAYYLNQYGVGAISGTSGESNLSIPLAQQFHGKTVYVCLDIDQAGVAAAEKVASILINYAKKVHTTSLPLDVKEFPNGDINDYVRVYKSDDNSFLHRAIVENSIVHELKKVEPYKQNGEVPKEMGLVSAIEGTNVGSRVQVKGRVTAILDQPYEIPKVIKIDCDKSQEFCSFCPVFHSKGNEEYTVPEESKSIISMCDAHEAIQHIELKAAVGIPKRCKVCTFKILSHYSIQEARISNVLSMTERENVAGMQTAYCVGNKLEPNCEYTFTGRNFAHAKTQTASFIFSKYDPLEDELSSYKGEGVADLNIFQPEKWTAKSIGDKLTKLYCDLEANVTYIYERRRMHLAIDLAYHSPLQFVLDDELQKGWVEILIVGDSSIGKTKTANNLKEHYGVGKRTSCKGATLAGLLGGLAAINNRWFVTWGIIPTYDKQLVILEELSGITKGAFQGMTDMRSTGIAEITKIEKRSTHARTRLIAISNPIKGKSVGSYTFGIQAIEELIRAPEDIRRFDLCLTESEDDIDVAKLSKLQSYRPRIHHEYTSELCRELILWGWSRDHSQIKFENVAIELLGPVVNKLCMTFSETCPIIDKGSTRYKVARLAAALAVRTFSNENEDTVLIRKCHVEFVFDMLMKFYSETRMGYLRYSESVQYISELRDTDIIRAQIDEIIHAKDFVSKLLYCTDFDLDDLCDWTEYPRDCARPVLSLLVRKNAISRIGKFKYKKSDAFNLYLHELFNSGELQNTKIKKPRAL